MYLQGLRPGRDHNADDRKACQTGRCNHPNDPLLRGNRLSPAADRTESGQRDYGTDDLEHPTFIQRRRDFFFEIKQVRLLAGLLITAEKDCREVGHVACDHLGEVQARRIELKAAERSLQSFVLQCDAVCPFDKLNAVRSSMLVWGGMTFQVTRDRLLYLSLSHIRWPMTPFMISAARNTSSLSR